jgi:hypothetical protein
VDAPRTAHNRGVDVKTAMMCGLAGQDPPVPAAHFRFLRKHLHPPAKVRIWTAIVLPQPGATEFRTAWFETRGLLFRGGRGTQFNG